MLSSVENDIFYIYYILLYTFILSFLLPLFQEGQLSVTGKSMCTKYWLNA